MNTSISLKSEQIVNFSKINIKLVKFKKLRKFLKSYEIARQANDTITD